MKSEHAHRSSLCGSPFKVNTGLREQEDVNLRWHWEVGIPEFGVSVFVIPRVFVKNGSDRYVVLNRIVRNIVVNCRWVACRIRLPPKGKSGY
jgi:hypothetical protein